MSTPAAFFDLDGTLTSGRIWRGLSRYSRTNRTNLNLYYPFVISHTLLWLMSKIRLVRSESFMRRWLQDMAIMFKGYSWGQAQELFYWIARREVAPGLHQQVMDQLRWHQGEGHIVVLVSGTFRELLQMVAEELRVPYAVGTILETHDGRYTGRITGPPCFGQEKAKQVLSFLKRDGLDVGLSDSYAYADRIYDLPLLEMVGHQVAVYPDGRLRRVARDRGWRIIAHEEGSKKG